MLYIYCHILHYKPYQTIIIQCKKEDFKILKEQLKKTDLIIDNYIEM